jgi:hydrogenase nickel incorporation protein HypA/HybF
LVHEWALAEAIILYIESQGVKRGRKLVVKTGALQSIDREVLEFALRELIKERGLEISEIEIIEEEPLLKCRTCGYEWRIEPSSMSQDVRESIHFLPESIYAYYRCPRCGSIDFEIVKGRGISEIKVEDHD